MLAVLSAPRVPLVEGVGAAGWRGALQGAGGRSWLVPQPRALASKLPQLSAGGAPACKPRWVAGVEGATPGPGVGQGGQVPWSGGRGSPPGGWAAGAGCPWEGQGYTAPGCCGAGLPLGETSGGCRSPAHLPN